MDKEYTIHEVPTDLGSEAKDMIATAHSSDSHYIAYAILSENLSRVVVKDVDHLKNSLSMDVEMKVSHLSLVHSKELNCLFLASTKKEFGTIPFNSSSEAKFSSLNMDFEEEKRAETTTSGIQFERNNLYVLASDSSQSFVYVFENYEGFAKGSPPGPWKPKVKYSHGGVISKFLPNGNRGFIIEEKSIKVIGLDEKQPNQPTPNETYSLPENTLRVFKVEDEIEGVVVDFFVQAERTTQIVNYDTKSRKFEKEDLKEDWENFFIIKKKENEKSYFLTWFNKKERYIGFYLTKNWSETLRKVSMEYVQTNGNKFYLSKKSSLGSVGIMDTALSPSNNIVIFEKNRHIILSVSKEFKCIISKEETGKSFKEIQEYVINGHRKTFLKLYLAAEGKFLIGQLLHDLVVFKLKKKSNTFALLENIHWDVGQEILNVHLVTRKSNPKMPKFLYVVALKFIHIIEITPKQKKGYEEKEKKRLKASENQNLVEMSSEILTSELIGRTLFIVRQDGSVVNLEMDGKSQPNHPMSEPVKILSEMDQKDATNLPYILVSQEKEAIIIGKSQVIPNTKEVKFRFSALQEKLFPSETIKTLPQNESSNTDRKLPSLFVPEKNTSLAKGKPTSHSESKKRFQISANRDVSFVAVWDGKPKGQISCFRLMTLDENKAPSLKEFKTISLKEKELKSQLKWSLTDIGVYGASGSKSLLILKTNSSLLAYDPDEGASLDLLETQDNNEEVYDLWGFAIGGPDKNEVIVSNSMNQLKTIRVMENNLETLQRPFQFLLYSVVVTQDKLFAIYDQTSLISLPLDHQKNKRKEEMKENQKKISNHEVFWDVSTSPISMLALKTDKTEKMSGLYVATFDWELLLLDQSAKFKKVGIQVLISEPIQLQEVLLKQTKYVVVTCSSSEATLYTADLSQVYRRIFLGVRVNIGDNFFVSTKSTESSLILYRAGTLQEDKSHVQKMTIDLKQGTNDTISPSQVEEEGKGKLEGTVGKQKNMRKLSIDLTNRTNFDPKTVSEILDGILDLEPIEKDKTWFFFSHKTKDPVASLSKTGDEILLKTKSGNKEVSVILNPQEIKNSQESTKIALFSNGKFGLLNFSSFFRVVSFSEADSPKTTKLLDVLKQDPLLNCLETHPRVEPKLIELEEKEKALFLVIPKNDETIKIVKVKGGLEKMVLSIENEGYVLMAIANRHLEAVYMDKKSGDMVIRRFTEENGKIKKIESLEIPKEASINFGNPMRQKLNSVFFDINDSTLSWKKANIDWETKMERLESGKLGKLEVKEKGKETRKKLGSSGIQWRRSLTLRSEKHEKPEFSLEAFFDPNEILIIPKEREDPKEDMEVSWENSKAYLHFGSQTFYVFGDAVNKHGGVAFTKQVPFDQTILMETSEESLFLYSRNSCSSLIFYNQKQKYRISLTQSLNLVPNATLGFKQVDGLLVLSFLDEIEKKLILIDFGLVLERLKSSKEAKVDVSGMVKPFIYKIQIKDESGPINFSLISSWELWGYTLESIDAMLLIEKDSSKKKTAMTLKKPFSLEEGIMTLKQKTQFSIIRHIYHDIIVHDEGTKGKKTVVHNISTGKDIFDFEKEVRCKGIGRNLIITKQDKIQVYQISEKPNCRFFLLREIPSLNHRLLTCSSDAQHILMEENSSEGCIFYVDSRNEIQTYFTSVQYKKIIQAKNGQFLIEKKDKTLLLNHGFNLSETFLRDSQYQLKASGNSYEDFKGKTINPFEENFIFTEKKFQVSSISMNSADFGLKTQLYNPRNSITDLKDSSLRQPIGYLVASFDRVYLKRGGEKGPYLVFNSKTKAEYHLETEIRGTRIYVQPKSESVDILVLVDESDENNEILIQTVILDFSKMEKHHILSLRNKNDVGNIEGSLKPEIFKSQSKEKQEITESSLKGAYSDYSISESEETEYETFVFIDLVKDERSGKTSTLKSFKTLKTFVESKKAFILFVTNTTKDSKITKIDLPHDISAVAEPGIKPDDFVFCCGTSSGQIFLYTKQEIKEGRFENAKKIGSSKADKIIALAKYQKYVASYEKSGDLRVMHLDYSTVVKIEHGFGVFVIRLDFFEDKSLGILTKKGEAFKLDWNINMVDVLQESVLPESRKLKMKLLGEKENEKYIFFSSKDTIHRIDLKPITNKKSSSRNNIFKRIMNTAKEKIASYKHGAEDNSDKQMANSKIKNISSFSVGEDSNWVIDFEPVSDRLFLVLFSNQPTFYSYFLDLSREGKNLATIPESLPGLQQRNEDKVIAFKKLAGIEKGISIIYYTSSFQFIHAGVTFEDKSWGNPSYSFQINEKIFSSAIDLGVDSTQISDFTFKNDSFYFVCHTTETMFSLKPNLAPQTTLMNLDKKNKEILASIYINKTNILLVVTKNGSLIIYDFVLNSEKEKILNFFSCPVKFISLNPSTSNLICVMEDDSCISFYKKSIGKESLKFLFLDDPSDKITNVCTSSSGVIYAHTSKGKILKASPNFEEEFLNILLSFKKRGNRRIYKDSNKAKLLGSFNYIENCHYLSMTISEYMENEIKNQTDLPTKKKRRQMLEGAFQDDELIKKIAENLQTKDLMVIAEALKGEYQPLFQEFLLKLIQQDMIFLDCDFLKVFQEKFQGRDLVSKFGENFWVTFLSNFFKYETKTIGMTIIETQAFYLPILPDYENFKIETFTNRQELKDPLLSFFTRLINWDNKKTNTHVQKDPQIQAKIGCSKIPILWSRSSSDQMVMVMTVLGSLKTPEGKAILAEPSWDKIIDDLFLRLKLGVGTDWLLFSFIPIVYFFIYGFYLNNETASHEEKWFLVGNIFFNFFVLVNLFFLFFQRWKTKKWTSFFFSFRNWLEMTTIVISTTYISMEFCQSKYDYKVEFYQVTFYLLILRFVGFLTLFDSMRNLIMRIFSITKNLWAFFLLLLISLVGFTHIYFVEEESDDVTYWDTTFRTYLMFFGDIETPNHSRYLPIFTFFLITFFLPILLMNLLVALLTDAYASVSNRYKEVTNGEKIIFILELYGRMEIIRSTILIIFSPLILLGIIIVSLIGIFIGRKIRKNTWKNIWKNFLKAKKKIRKYFSWESLEYFHTFEKVQRNKENLEITGKAVLSALQNLRSELMETIETRIEKRIDSTNQRIETIASKLEKIIKKLPALSVPTNQKISELKEEEDDEDEEEEKAE